MHGPIRRPDTAHGAGVFCEPVASLIAQRRTDRLLKVGFTAPQHRAGVTTVVGFVARSLALTFRLRPLVVDTGRDTAGKVDEDTPADRADLEQRLASAARGRGPDDAEGPPHDETGVMELGGQLGRMIATLDVKRFEALSDLLGQSFDVALFDMAPPLPGSRTLLLAPRLDMMLLVVRAGACSADDAAAACTRCAAVGRPVDGVILNDIAAQSSRGWT